MNIRSYMSLSLLVVAVLFLPQCDWFTKKEVTESASHDAGSKESLSGKSAESLPGAAGDVLLASHGKTLITVADFEKYIEQACKVDPNKKVMVEKMPGAEEGLFRGMETEKILDLWATENGIEKKEDFKQELAAAEKYVRQQLSVKYFFEQHPVNISDAEVRKFYDENKDKFGEFKQKAGGVNAQVVKFDSAEKANSFLEKAKSAGFAAALKEFGVTPKTLDRVNESSYDVEGPVREKLLAVTKVPSVELVKKDDKNIWVINVVSKEQTVYKPFEELKEPLREYLAYPKRMEILQKEIEELKKKYGISENIEYFKRKNKQLQAELQKQVPATGVQRAEAPVATKPSAQAA